MCKPDKPDPVTIEPPSYLRNPFLDDARNPASAARALRAGRSSLRIPLGGRPAGVDPGSTSGASRSPGAVLGAQGNGRPMAASGAGWRQFLANARPKVNGISA